MKEVCKMKKKFHCYCGDCRNLMYLFTTCDSYGWCEKYRMITAAAKRNLYCHGFKESK